MLAVSALSVSAQDYSGGQQQYASDGQYATTTAEQTGCGWYWDYTFSKSGGWEWWCWSPEWGWWYGENENGKKKIVAPKVTTNGPLQFFSS
jgi:hypothetical protein